MSTITNPLFGSPAPTNGTSTSGTSSSTTTGSNSQLGANSFISLLTAELQAQDPTNPMNPEDMLNQLVSMNSLQSLLNIQQILTVATGVNPSQTSSGTSSGTGTGTQTSNALPAAQMMPARTVAGPSASNHDAIFQYNQLAASGLSNQ